MEKVKYWASVIGIACATRILEYLNFLFALVALAWILLSIMLLVDSLIFSSLPLLLLSLIYSITAYIVIPSKWRKLYED